ncbi:MAG: hypothetical protein SNG10_02450 [Rikenellaceae bacterium]
MKKLFINLNMHLSQLEVMKNLRKWISPIFLMMLVASFVLWYIAKLSYTYTTELNVDVEIEGQVIDVKCVVQGVGTNLFGYKIKGGRDLKIPISELRYDAIGADSVVSITPTSLSGAISVRYSDIKIISIDAQTDLEMTPNLSEAIIKAEKRR